MSERPPPDSVKSQAAKTQGPTRPALHLPPGFVLATASDGAPYAAPDFLIPAAEHAIESHILKKALKFGTPIRGAFPHNYAPAVNMGDNPKISCPPDPGLNEREMLLLHAEVLALQQQLGISYKDAAHRLYLAEAKAAAVEADAVGTTQTIAADLDVGLHYVVRQPVAASQAAHEKSRAPQ